jgi:hypothetical protein
VITLACDLDVFARGIPTGFAAIFLVRSNVTKTRYVRALAVLLTCHFAISFFKSIVLFQRLSIASSFIAFGSPNFAIAHMRAFLCDSATRQPESMSKARHSVGLRTG